MWFERLWAFKPSQRGILDAMGDELADAIKFLRGREHAVQTQIASLDVDLRKIRDALSALGMEPQPSRTDDEPTTVNDESESRTPDETPAPGANVRRYGRSVRALVQEVLESENRAWTSAEVQEAVRAEVGPERVDERLQATVRTALWTLGKHGQSVRDDSGRHVAAKWHTSTETPAGTGVSGTAPTTGLGGEDHEAQNSHRHDPSRRNGDHHSAPVVEASTR